MSNQLKDVSNNADHTLTGECEVRGLKKAYETPVLVHHGDVRDITLGPTIGIGESGNELGFRNPP